MAELKKLVWLIAIGIVANSFTPRKITWVAIGDSITYLNEHTDETGNRVSKGYIARVVEKLPNINYINQGHNGWTSGGIAKEIDNLGIVKADVYWVPAPPTTGGREPVRGICRLQRQYGKLDGNHYYPRPSPSTNCAAYTQ